MKPRGVLTHGTLVERELLVGLLIHHVHAAMVLIQDLHLLRIETRFLEEISGGQSLIERVARDEIAEPHLHERPEVARSPVRKVHDAARLAVDHENMPFADIGCFHGSGNLNRLP